MNPWPTVGAHPAMLTAPSTILPTSEWEMQSMLVNPPCPSRFTSRSGALTNGRRFPSITRTFLLVSNFRSCIPSICNLRPWRRFRFRTNSALLFQQSSDRGLSPPRSIGQPTYAASYRSSTGRCRTSGTLAALWPVFLECLSARACAWLMPWHWILR